ncbi:MAG: type II toxin-antitoxin system PemK/MazF family toxin [Candidatus Aminicenantes bacterium]|nr:type II toxin-antitoxin system PemK/MazF family toxin [Candidatus Aminicenantes bacterium]
MDADFPRHGEIWLAALDPAFGREIGKTRPAVILSNDRGNQYAETVTIVPISSKTDRVFPYEAGLSGGETGLTQDSKAKANQVRTIDKRRLQKNIGRVPLSKLEEIKRAVKIHLAID